MNGKGYDINNNIVYELKNGNGYVKEYNDFTGKLMFEGEYINGQRNGRSKAYYLNKKLNFEGEYFNDKRKGEGKEYNNKGQLEFVGEYLYDYKLKGKYYIKNQLEYDGEYLYDKKWHGKGYDENGNVIYELFNGNGRVKEYIIIVLKYFFII